MADILGTQRISRKSYHRITPAQKTAGGLLSYAEPLISGQRINKRSRLERQEPRARLRKKSAQVEEEKSLDLRIPGYVLLGILIVGVIFSLGSNIMIPRALVLPEDLSYSRVLEQYLLLGPNISEEELLSIPDFIVPESYNSAVQTHVIAAGETLDEIGLQYDVSVASLISINNIKNVKRLTVGTKITIPPRDGVVYTVRPGDNLSSISYYNDVSITEITDINDLDSTAIYPGQKLFLPGVKPPQSQVLGALGLLWKYPVTGRFTSGFGYRTDPFSARRSMHTGVDWSADIGTRINAARSGRVVSVANWPSLWGNYIIIQHDDGFQSLYAHLSKFSVRKGQYVDQGQKIGEVGNTGRSSGAHLHFGVYKNGTPINPLSLF
jgi:murein DD-endopeptidase MepM/ murein hydrolase activator NlpD